jgi:hypothetical protein
MGAAWPARARDGRASRAEHMIRDAARLNSTMAGAVLSQ